MNIDHQKKRSRNIILAVCTSIISKGGNVLLMLIAIPLAYHVLGEERAAIYGVMQSLMWLVSMSDLGTGPGMVRRLAGAVAEGDKERQGAVVSTGFFLTLALALIGAIVFSALLTWVPVTTLFSDAFADYADELKHTAWVSLAVFFILMILACMERVREGFQEVHIGNAFGSVYNVTAALVLWLGMAYFHTPVFLVLAVYGMLIFFSSANVISLLWKRPWLRPSLRKMDRTVVRGMTREGLALFVAGSVAPILIREAPKFMLGRAGAHAAADVAHYWILIQLGLIGMGFIMMVTRPLWPAMAEAAYRQDFSWIKYARQRMMQLFIPCAVIIVCAFSLLGPWFTEWWLKTRGGLTRMHLTTYGVLFVLTAWSHMHYVMLGSLGMARAAAKVLLFEALLILFLSWWGIQWNGLAGAIVGASAGMLAVSAWAMPLLLGRALRSRTGPEEEESPVMVPA